MGTGGPEELAEFRALSAKVAARAASEPELQRWRELRTRLAAPPPPPARTPPATPRAHARVARKVRLHYQPVKAMRVTFAEEISAGGMRINVSEHLEEGTELLVRVELGDGDPITTLARVIWCQRDGGHFVAGLEFIDLRLEERERVEGYAHSATEAPQPPR